MKKAKRSLAVLLIVSTVLLQTGCWNYREIDEVAIVAGVAVDKGTAGKYKLTVEIMHIEGGRDAKVLSHLVSVEGKTMFDAVRNVISESGQRLYWSHAKEIIISQEVARNGVAKIIDWYNRDSETRATVNIFVSGRETAGEIFSAASVTEDIKSLEIEKIMENEKSLSKAPSTEIWKFTNDIEGEGIEPAVPVISCDSNDKSKNIKIEGTAIFKNDEFKGLIDGEETKDMLFIQNKIKGGLLTQIEPGKEGDCAVTLEIFGNKTKVEPVLNNGKIEINVKTETEVAIDEIEGSENFIEEDGRKKLEADTENMLKGRLEKTIKNVQSEYGLDIFGFGAKVRQEKPDLWDAVGNDWNTTFADLKVNVSTKIHIKNSAMTSKTIEVGK
jgi:spore germination protein KC